MIKRLEQPDLRYTLSLSLSYVFARIIKIVALTKCDRQDIDTFFLPKIESKQ